MRRVPNTGLLEPQKGDVTVDVTDSCSALPISVSQAEAALRRHAVPQDANEGKDVASDTLPLQLAPRAGGFAPQDPASTSSHMGGGSLKTPNVSSSGPIIGPVRVTPDGSSFFSAQSGHMVRPKLRASATGLSMVSASSVTSIRALDTPKLRRSVTALSTQSLRTESSMKSSVLDFLEFDMNDMKDKRNVPITSHWPIHDIYDFHNMLGKGSYGTVWHGVNKQTDDEFAIKCIPVVRLPDVERLEAEMKILARLRNPYIVRLHEVYRDREHLHLVMDLCRGGDLMDYLMGYWSNTSADVTTMHMCGGLPWSEVPPLLWQMLAAAAYLHHNRFCHRDIKLENFMLKSSSQRVHLLLADFGLSVRFARGETIRGAVGSLMYVAPEVLVGTYTEKCDIWSIGVTTYCLCTKRNPWGDDLQNQAMVNNITNNIREDWPQSDKPPELMSLVDRLMTPNIAERPSAKMLLRDSAFLRKHGLAPSNDANGCCTIA